MKRVLFQAQLAEIVVERVNEWPVDIKIIVVGCDRCNSRFFVICRVECRKETSRTRVENVPVSWIQFPHSEYCVKGLSTRVIIDPESQHTITRVITTPAQFLDPVIIQTSLLLFVNSSRQSNLAREVWRLINYRGAKFARALGASSLRHWALCGTRQSGRGVFRWLMLTAEPSLPRTIAIHPLARR